MKNVTQNLLALPPGHGNVFDGRRSGDLMVNPIIDLDSTEPEGPAGIKSNLTCLYLAGARQSTVGSTTE
jgi:hypothetical protein